MRVERSLIKVSILALFSGILPAVFGAPVSKQAQFFSGVYLLQSLPGLSTGEKAQKFRELEQLTGIDAGKARTMLSRYDARPAEWRTICDSMIQMITGAQVKTPAPAVPKSEPPLPGARR
jgi:hypothetical protein